jgi:hypothetical protein
MKLIPKKPTSSQTAEYIITRFGALKVALSSTYPGMYQIAGETLHVSGQALGQIAESERSPLWPPDCGIAYRLREGQAEFEQFYVDWLGDVADLYRGIPGCHFCWPVLVRDRQLQSEGMHDIPTFTMGSNTPTRWLPTARDFDIAYICACQCADAHTQKLSLTTDVPLGIVVQVRVGRTRGIPTAWLNSGEIVVRGPLDTSQFTLHTLAWLKNTGLGQSRWPAHMDASTLMPQRPYQPGLEQTITTWWGTCLEWLTRRGSSIGWVLRKKGG